MRCKACGATEGGDDRLCAACVHARRTLLRRVPLLPGPNDLELDSRGRVYRRMTDGSVRFVGQLET